MKRTALALVAVALVPLAAACGSDDEASSTTAAASTAAAVTTAAPTTAAATTVAATTVPTTTAAAPTTTAAATTMAAATTTAGSAPTFADPDEQAAVDAFIIVYDSNAPFDDKAPHLADAEALKTTIEAYTTAGGAMGGISLVPTSVAVDGDNATVTYDVMFGGTAAYTGLTGTITKTADGTWQVTRADFCSFMSQARTPCA